MADLEDGEILDSDSEDIVDESTVEALGSAKVKVDDGGDEMNVDQVKETTPFNHLTGHHNSETKAHSHSDLLNSNVKQESTNISFQYSNVKAEPSGFVKKELDGFSFHESNMFNVRENASQFSTRRSPQKPHQNRDRLGAKYNDDGSSASSDEDTDLWKCKKARYFSSSKEKSAELKAEITSPPRNGQKYMGISNPTANKSKVRKINNVWGSVLAEQDVSAIFSSVGVEKNPEVEESDRNVEKYDFTKAYEDTDRPYLAEMRQECHDPFHKVVNVDITDLEKDIVKNVNPSLKRKRGSVKDRIMDLSEWTYDEKKSREHFGVTFEDSDAKIVNAIAIQLDEPKIDLLAKVVEILGSKKALETAYLTEDVEDAGGMMTLDGFRRRTPGGVYIQLLKKDKEVSKSQYKEIFGEEERQYKKACRMEQKRRRQDQRRLYNSLPQSRYSHNSNHRNDTSERMDDGSNERTHHKKKKKKKKRREKHDSEMKDDNNKSSKGESDNDTDDDTGEGLTDKGGNSPGLDEAENFDEEIEDIVIG